MITETKKSVPDLTPGSKMSWLKSTSNSGIIGFAKISHVYHAGNNGLLESNLCTSGTNNEQLILFSPSTLLSEKGERVPLVLNFCSATKYRTRILSAKASVASWNSVNAKSRSRRPIEHANGFDLQHLLPRNKVPIIKFEVAIYWKKSFEIRSAKHGQQDSVLIDPSIFTT